MNDNQPLTKIIIVDDHSLFRMMLKASFDGDHPDICVVGEANNGEELFRMLPHTPIDLVLLDINMPGISGVEVTLRLRKEYPSIKILAVSAENSAETVRQMIEAGIEGFVSKQCGSAQELAQAIRSVMSGLEYFGRDIASIIYDLYVSKKKTTSVTSEFTDREREIILLCRDGLICKEIAARLGIAERTVNTHKEKIFGKLGINNTMEMVLYAMKNGIIRIDS
ncbi:MAG: response regulator transcription factor [Prevotellaceae bacterium]|nr:response regulator transcription factor [Prevotellaceae bacterium]